MKLTMNDISGLRDLARTKEGAALFMYLSKRERSVRAPHYRTHICRFEVILRKQGLWFEDYLWYELWRLLDKCNVGFVKEGAHGHPIYFTWKYHPRDVARIALGERIEARYAAYDRNKHLFSTFADIFDKSSLQSLINAAQARLKELEEYEANKSHKS